MSGDDRQNSPSISRQNRPSATTQVAGLKNKKNQIRVICTKCGVEMVRTVVSRRHDVIDMYAPAGMEHSDLELREY